MYDQGLITLIKTGHIVVMFGVLQLNRTYDQVLITLIKTGHIVVMFGVGSS